MPPEIMTPISLPAEPKSELNKKITIRIEATCSGKPKIPDLEMNLSDTSPDLIQKSKGLSRNSRNKLA